MLDIKLLRDDPERIATKLRDHGVFVFDSISGTRIADRGEGVAAVASHLRRKDLKTASRYIDRWRANARALSALER